jgi:hypothetical protein
MEAAIQSPTSFNIQHWRFVLVTDPDRSYDICVGGACVSPGCGDSSCNVPGPSFRLGDSGQLECFDAAAAIPCPGDAGVACGATPYCGQDAQYGSDTTGSGERFQRKSGSGEPVVSDSVTGLEWQGCLNGSSGEECALGSPTPVDWATALELCDALVWNGADDWRLPDPYEVQSLGAYGRHSPAVDVVAFPRVTGGYVWSSATSSVWPSQAIGRCTLCGDTAAADKTGARFVRCVRRGAAVVGRAPLRFERRVVGGDPVVHDGWSGLEWIGCPLGVTTESCAGAASTFDWAGAVAACEDASWAGHSDWRLPNVVELHSILDQRHSAPTIDPMFAETPPARFWTGTTFTHYPDHAWAGEFDSGTVFGQGYGKSGLFFARCVR